MRDPLLIDLNDDPFKGRCRQIQSWYREKIIREEPGRGPNKGSATRIGNYLNNGEKTGRNFLDGYIFRYAKSKVLEKQINPDLTINEYRLFNNMLSSMPMAFNLFGLIRRFLEDNNPDTTQIIISIFPEFNWISEVTYMDVEYIPRPIENYTGDKSAFDVMLLAKDNKGKKGIISIETKYTDLLGNNSASKRAKKDTLVKDENLFKDMTPFEEGYSQLARNFLLTLAYKNFHKLQYFEHVVLSPREDHHSQKEIDTFKLNLNKFKDKITKMNLEDYVERARKCGNDEYVQLIDNFHERYLHFSSTKRLPF